MCELCYGVYPCPVCGNGSFPEDEEGEEIEEYEPRIEKENEQQ